jgi:hypothetical protein
VITEKKNRFMIMKRLFFISILAVGAGCASAPNYNATVVTDPAQFYSNLGVASPTLLSAAEKELELALQCYDVGDWAGSEQGAVKAARILYSVETPQNGEGRKYAELTSKLSLLTVRLNRFLHNMSPELEPERFTMSIPYNERIEKEIDVFLGPGRESFARWLRRSGQYLPMLKKYFVEAGLPADLVYLALIESGFNPRNRSPKQAVGLFQFIRGTAQMVGLEENYWLDERRHPEKAAQAAIKHIRSLYSEFNNWDLALAAYNAGSGRVRSAIREQHQNDYWKLALPLETEEYVPKFYATLIIAREPELYGFNPKLEEDPDIEVAEIPGGVDFKVIADCTGVTLSVISDLNTELTKNCTPPGNEPYLLRLPIGTAKFFAEHFSNYPEDKRFLTEEEISRRKLKGIYFVYQVKNGDSLFGIAVKNHTTVAKIKQWNSSVRESKYIHPGQKLRIYRSR